jgi:hypothetical protein
MNTAGLFGSLLEPELAPCAQGHTERNVFTSNFLWDRHERRAICSLLLALGQCFTQYWSHS